VLYKMLYNLIFTRFDAEFAHHAGMLVIRTADAIGLTKLTNISRGKTAEFEAFGKTFKGPFGVAAGFDKNAVAVRALGRLGFSHVEVGTVTAIAQSGNEKPRLFRLVADRALINRMGFNNQGAEAVAERLTKLRLKNPVGLPVIGVNIGKSRAVEVENAVADYQASARALAPVADYIAVNVSSPNTPGLRSLQATESLKPILEAVLVEAKGVPVLVKIAPDLADQEILQVADLAIELGLAGVIATNTTISRQALVTPSQEVERMGAGGLSGAPLKARSLEVLNLLCKRLDGRAAVVSVGGIETAQEAAERIKAGATLVQGYTGFIYFGPLWARKINRSFEA